MARYIDAELALKIIDSYAKTVTADGKVVVDAIRDIVEVITPTADVVPKSEVFLASSDAIKMLIECHGYALTHDADIKKEVAREIFEEIEALFPTDKKFTTISQVTIKQLKKKYTEKPKKRKEQEL